MSPLVGEARMRFDVVIGPRAGAAGYDELGRSGEQVDRIADGDDDVTHEQKDRGKHGMSRVGTVAAAMHGGRRGRFLAVGLSGQAEQRGQVVGQDLGCHVDDERLLAKPETASR
jgi:hypothetical protein